MKKINHINIIKPAFDVDIITTGSKGNCLIVDDCVMIDCGITRKEFINYFDKLDALFVSHQHTDHITISVLNWIFQKHTEWFFKNVYLNLSTWQYLREKSKFLFNLQLSEVNILRSDREFDIKTRSGDYHVELFQLVHDVENQGFIFTNEDGQTLIHATDTSSMKHCPNRKFDVICCEGNYDEDMLAEDLASDEYAISFRASRNLRHLSIQQFENFVNTHSYQHSLVRQLHQSHDFGFQSSINLRKEWENDKPVFDN